MCGFVAVLAASQRLPAPLLDRMRDRMSHRGPDGAGSWIGPAGDDFVVGLGHRRLAILDLSEAANQPMFGSDDCQAIVYNGEIYNFVELREELEGLGHRFRTQSDTEVLLAAFAQWGADCLPRLNGMFGFAIWDSRSRELFVARDRFGEKPVFHAALPGGGIVIASEIKALLAHPDVPLDADPKKLSHYARRGVDDSTAETMFGGIVRLPPAHAMVIGADGGIRRQWRYWTPDYAPVRDRYDEPVAVARFREMMERSIAMRLRSDVPVGSSLSGGLDSSTIVALLAQLREAGTICTQNAFSARFDDDPTLSEGPQIDSVIAKTGANAFGVTPDPVQLIADCARVHWHQEEPFASASIYLQFCVARLAQENGTIVLLDGQGADELLAGYQPYFKQFQLDLADKWQFRRLASETDAFTGRLKIASADYADSRRRFDEQIALGIPKTIAKGLLPKKLTSRANRPGVPPAAAGQRLRRRMAEALQYSSLPALLRYADRNGMAFGREMRFPFLDHELVDWCIGSLPDRAFIRDGWQKMILRQAGEGVLPPDIQWRADKVGYAAPQDVWLRGPMKEWSHDNLFSGPVTDVPGYDRRRLEGLWESHQSGDGDSSWALWRWISLNQWLLLMQDGVWRDGIN